MMRANSLKALMALLPVAVVCTALVGGASATNNDRSAAGLWQATDEDTHQPSAWFLIRDNSGVYTGTIVKMFLKPGQDPGVVCSKCTDDRHDKPWLGLQIIRGMRRSGSEYVDGTILDPRDGNVYNAIMKLSRDGQTLTVRGYLGIAFLGRNQYWTRLPDSALKDIDPTLNSDATRINATPPARKSTSKQETAQR
jgi:uncharacterized protein (DUF2147 family)